MNQVYKAVDSGDGQLCYFYFDGQGRRTIVGASICDEKRFVMHVKKKGGDFVDFPPASKRMVNPILISEW